MDRLRSLGVRLNLWIAGLFIDLAMAIAEARQ
jgi:hypothetical protein